MGYCGKRIVKRWRNLKMKYVKNLILDYAQIAFVSAKEHKITYIIPYINEASENHKKRVQSSTLNEVVTDAISMNPTPTDKR